MKYKCLGPYIFEKKEYSFGDVIITNKKLKTDGFLTVIDNTEEEKTEEVTPKEENITKKQSKDKK